MPRRKPPRRQSAKAARFNALAATLPLSDGTDVQLSLEFIVRKNHADLDDGPRTAAAASNTQLPDAIGTKSPPL